MADARDRLRTMVEGETLRRNAVELLEELGADQLRNLADTLEQVATSIEDAAAQVEDWAEFDGPRDERADARDVALGSLEDLMAMLDNDLGELEVPDWLKGQLA